ncbi:MAG: preprotein translocase subunit SecG [Parvibaculaceae bacterium]|nr:preprotein translocase subunit SecG [Parvibaculaceae bacterium]
MATIILVIHLMIAVALVAVVLLQRSEGGALGIGGGGGGGGFMSGRGVGSALTRATAILAAAFFVTSLALGFIAARGGKSSILDGLAPAPSTSGITVPAPLTVPQADQSAPAPGATPAPAPAAPATTPAAPAAPSTPAVPRAQ